MSFPVRAYLWLIRFGWYLAIIVLLLVRLAWGWECYQSGNGHLHHLDTTTAFFQTLNIPMPHLNAVISGWTELVGGILLMVGLASRLIAIPLAFNFCVAIYTDGHDQLLHVFKDPSKLVDYTAFPFLIAALVVLAFGPGPISIDGILARTVFRRQRKAAPQAAST